MVANYPVDLHSHTYLSDGADSINELVENAVERGLKVLALTDHDILPPAEVHLPGGGSHSLVKWARSHGLFLMRGVEFSCESNVEDVHIVGLGCNWESAEMCNVVQDISKSKATAYEETVRRLNERGYKFTIDELLQSGSYKVDIFSLQKKRIFDFMATKGFVSSWVGAKLLVRDDAYLNVHREKPSAKYIIDVIHRTGGIAILAHPYLIDPAVVVGGRQMERWDFIETLIDSGLDGIETRYPYGKTTYKDKRPSEEIWAEVAQRAAGRLILSGGSDYHADWKKKNQNPRELGECGMTISEFMAVPYFAKLYHQAMDADN